MAGAFSIGSPNCFKTKSLYSGYGIQGNIAFNGYGDSYSYSSIKSWTNSPLANLTWSNGTRAGSTTYDIAVKVDFSNMQMTGSTLRNYWNDKGFSILCSGCSQYINIKFSSEISSSASERSRDPYSYSSEPIEYTIGISNVKDGKGLAKALFDGIKAINREDGYNARVSSGIEVSMLDTNHAVNIMKMNGSYYLTKNYSPNLVIKSTLVGTGDNDDDEPVPEESSYEVLRQNPLTIHHGTHANQAIKFYINNMRTGALKGSSFPSEADEARMQSMDMSSEEYTAFINTISEASEKSLEEASVTTKHDANVSIRIIDGALDYALGEATKIGAYLQRLEYTEMNVNTENENTQGAESTIRDADMAKEMTEYTKNNVLSQASQSMLAQANQNLSGVLGLLQ